MYNQVFWINPGRKRDLKAKYDNVDYAWYYDLDQNDFTELVLKVKSNIALDYNEDVRYGKYIQTISEIVLENYRFKRKPQTEKSELRENMYFELAMALPKFDPTRGSAIFSYAYRVAYIAVIHHYKDIEKDRIKKEAIAAHVMSEYLEYKSDIGNHKVCTNGKYHEAKDD